MKKLLLLLLLVSCRNTEHKAYTKIVPVGDTVLFEVTTDSIYQDSAFYNFKLTQ